MADPTIADAGSMPQPLTPADCDLRGYEFMPLFGHRLFSSQLNEEATDAEFRACITLWWSAWQNCPAGSVSSSDAVLARVVGYGKDVRAWLKAKKIVLHGFVLCSDGRLYHPIICEAAVKAYESRLKASKTREADRERLRKWRLNRDSEQTAKPSDTSDGNDGQPNNETRDEAPFETDHETRFETSDKRVRDEMRGDKRRKEREEPPYAPPAETFASPPAAQPKTRRKAGSHLSPDWMPTLDERRYAIDRGLDADAIALDFRDYWIGHGKPMADWLRTWQRWCREAETRQARRVIPHRSNGFLSVSTDSILDRIEADRRREEANAQTH